MRGSHTSPIGAFGAPKAAAGLVRIINEFGRARLPGFGRARPPGIAEFPPSSPRRDNNGLRQIGVELHDDIVVSK